MPAAATVFDLPARLAAKTDDALIGADEAHLSAVAAALDAQVADLVDRLGALRRAPGGTGRAAMDRDLEIHRLTADLRVLRRFGLDVCLGRMITDDPAAGPLYVGRIGVTDPDGERLLIDWRTPAAEPFFAATPADPQGLVARRRYRWSAGRIVDYWDEVFTPEAADGPYALDDDSAFLRGLADSRSPQMRDVLATIAADQDAIIRADSHGALVVDGGPGTGKTVVALHRAAYLLYADPRLSGRRGGVLVVGPHRPYLAYVADVLPSLGEDGVQTCTLADLVPEGATALAESDPVVARLKAGARMVEAIEPAVRLYEDPPRQRVVVDTDWGEVSIGRSDWAEAFAAVDPGTPHNLAHDQIWDALAVGALDRLDPGRGRWPRADPDDAFADPDDDSDDDPGEDLDDLDDELPTVAELGRVLRADGELAELLRRSWTLVDPADLVGDLWSVPAYLRRCAPWLSDDEVARLQRPEPQAWTAADLPLLDAARQRLGDRDAALQRRRRQALADAERERMYEVVDDLVRTDDTGLMIMLRQEIFADALVDEASLPGLAPDRLAGPFAHVVVDEAQELTDAEWQVLLRRCPSRSFTVVGDRAQARAGFLETWAERLGRVGFGALRQAELTLNYRTPAEIMEAATPVITAVFPEANVPRSVRRSGRGVLRDMLDRLPALVGEWLAGHAEGTVCVITDPGRRPAVEQAVAQAVAGLRTGTADRDDEANARVRVLPPEQVKGLEFDLVVLVDEPAPADGVPVPVITAAVDRYVAMTRATRELVVLSPAG
ncbi:hypothetical protein FHX74_000198 [Friedmanniella endophytica]|uniref:UvrD-like helicase ATP-binding domain-containing protein n=1 Tax=Microlunatus kandeliicorticis TaxID=1759536 RepID=A0A7W3IP07_9ACTN|nr:RNA polymerase recycling motor ATPase HelR [Microlunatus kandeliicorticis]MBA8792604.1 hypothetical protein [Microlunatus kandeliicorticis]